MTEPDLIPDDPPKEPPATEWSPLAELSSPPADLPADPSPGDGVQAVPHVADELQLAPPRGRRKVLPALLFLTTCVTTFCAGVYAWEPAWLDMSVFERLPQFWRQGLTYMVACMAVLLAHEMGHFLMTVRYAIPASFPVFIPVPIMMTGTMGAVIGMDGSRADRKQLFDIGLAGPLAGLVLTIPLVCFGIRTAVPVSTAGSPVMVRNTAATGRVAVPEAAPRHHYGQPLLVKMLIPYLRPEWGPNQQFLENALYMAGWVGMLITGLNMLPISQLDGGHVLYALLGRPAWWVARAFLFAVMAWIIYDENQNWLLMVVLVTFLGVDHPPTSNDKARLGPIRWILGVASLAIPILCFTPVPLDFY